MTAAIIWGVTGFLMGAAALWAMHLGREDYREGLSFLGLAYWFITCAAAGAHFLARAA
jgi:hypothetical protein